jgi:hypothetical protein
MMHTKNTSSAALRWAFPLEKNCFSQNLILANQNLLIYTASRASKKLTVCSTCGSFHSCGKSRSVIGICNEADGTSLTYPYLGGLQSHLILPREKTLDLH